MILDEMQTASSGIVLLRMSEDCPKEGSKKKMKRSKNFTQNSALSLSITQ